MQFVFVNIYRFFQKRPGLFRFILALLFIVLITGASSIRFEQDINKMIPKHQELSAMDQVLNHTRSSGQLLFSIGYKDSTISRSDSLLWYAKAFKARLLKETGDALRMEAGPNGGADYTQEILSLALEYLPVWLSPQHYVQLDSLLRPERLRKHLEAERKRLLSPAGMLTAQYLPSDPIGILPMVLTQFQQLQQDTGYVSYGGGLFNRRMDQLYFFARPVDSSYTSASNQQLITKVAKVTERWESRYPQLSLSYFGAPAVAAENALQMKRDTVLTLSLTVLLLLTFTYYIFRKKRIPLLLFLPVLFGGLFGLAVTAWIQDSMSIIALGVGALILGIALDFSIHFLNHARSEPDREEQVRQLAHPLTLGALTTIAAFFSLRFAEAPVLRDLGTFAALSLLGASLFTLICLPQLTWPGRQNKTAQATRNVVDYLAKGRPEKSRLLLTLVLLLTPVLWYFAGKVQFDGDLMNLNYLSPRLEKAQEEFSKENDFALRSTYLVAEGESEDAAIRKLSHIAPLLNQLQEAGKIRAFQLPSAVLPSRKAQLSRIDRWKDYWDSTKVHATYQTIREVGMELGFAENAFTPFLQTLTQDYMPLDTTAAGFLKSLMPNAFGVTASGPFVLATVKPEPGMRGEVLETLQSASGKLKVTDRQAFSERLLESVKSDFNTLLFISGALVFLTLLLAYGRIELALMAFLPMTITWIWILGLMALLGLKFNFINVIISTLIFGLGDDYSIFMMDSLLKQYKTGKTEIRKIRSGIYLSVITTIIGLGTLAFASHPALKSIAWVTILGLLCVTVISQIIQPFLFNFMIQRRADKGFMPFTLWSLLKSAFSFFYFFTGCLLVTLCGFFFMGLRPFGRKRSKYIFHWILSKYTGSVMNIMANVRKRFIKYDRGIFQKPAIYIANHSSFLDILLTTMLHPRLILITNKWVWRSPVFGKIVRMAEYYPAVDGAEESIRPLQKLVAEGYGIVVFPEGTRSWTDKMGRFHKGAFFLAEKLKLDIYPIILHGVHYTMQKGDWLLKNGTTSVHLYPAIRNEDRSWGDRYQDRAKSISRFFKASFARIKQEAEQPVYFKEQIIRSYTYKGPVTEWYCRIKTRIENYYQPFHRELPRSGLFYDLGCGYGFMTFMLHWAAPERKFVGVDYDEEKIATAAHNYTLNRPNDTNKPRFEHGDVNRVDLLPCQGILISDVLHYLMPDDQNRLLEKSVQALLPGGKLIVRDGVTELSERHRTTRITELFSTRILKFNKTGNALHYLSKNQLVQFAERHQLKWEVLDRGGRTSNLIFIFSKTS